MNHFKKLKNRFFYIDQNKFVSEKLIYEINKSNNLKSKCDFIKLYFFSYTYKIKDLIFIFLQKFIKIKEKKLPTLKMRKSKTHYLNLVNYLKNNEKYNLNFLYIFFF